MKARRIIRTSDNLVSLYAELGNRPQPFTVTIEQGGVKTRTIPQNSLLHMWFGEIAKQRGDVTLDDVKGECHRRWGLMIRMRNPQFAFIWNSTGAKMDYEKQCKLLASGVLSVSSGMEDKELREYLNEVSRHFRGEGFRLTEPEERV